jgi:Recombinase/Recombinase zinc beta ribbon domain
LSRREVRESLTILLQILNAGINIATLSDDEESVYSAENLDELLLFRSIVILSRSHLESKRKSDLGLRNWQKKRELVQTKKLTKWCPAWLRLREDRSAYEEIKERVALVRSIFADTVAGIGGHVVTKRLNERGVPVMGPSKGWHPSYIAKILNNRAVLGEYQPCKTVDGKRAPVGDPAKGYFLAIISEDLFYSAQQARRQRLSNGRSRKGPYLSNLFSSIIWCAYCTSRMMYSDKGTPPKGRSFLVCEAARRGHGCRVTTGWRYRDFEASFLAFVEEVDLPDLLRDTDSERKRLDAKFKVRKM